MLLSGLQYPRQSPPDQSPLDYNHTPIVQQRGSQRCAKDPTNDLRIQINEYDMKTDTYGLKKESRNERLTHQLHAP